MCSSDYSQNLYMHAHILSSPVYTERFHFTGKCFSRVWSKKVILQVILSLGCGDPVIMRAVFVSLKSQPLNLWEIFCPLEARPCHFLGLSNAVSLVYTDYSMSKKVRITSPTVFWYNINTQTYIFCTFIILPWFLSSLPLYTTSVSSLIQSMVGLTKCIVFHLNWNEFRAYLDQLMSTKFNPIRSTYNHHIYLAATLPSHSLAYLVAAPELEPSFKIYP